MSPSSKIDFELNEHPRWNKNCFHLKRLATWHINSGSIKFPPVCPWIARMYNKVPQEFWQYWNRVFMLPFQIWLIQSLSVKVPPLCFMNVNFSFWLINLQWLAPSASLSRRFSWRTNFPTIFETWCPNVFVALLICSEVFPLSFINRNVVNRWTALRSWLNSRLFCINFLRIPITAFFKVFWTMFWFLVS